MSLHVDDNLFWWISSLLALAFLKSRPSNEANTLLVREVLHLHCCHA
uniref:Uncharacterized protein n=1 Tax=Arundo donax TaxID=35708 RepID=A0A0A8YHY6_ARUDO